MQPDHRPHICRRHIDHLSMRWQLRQHLPCRQWLWVQIAISTFGQVLELALMFVAIEAVAADGVTAQPYLNVL